jgi:release factor glutamine methyltransferase
VLHNYKNSTGVGIDVSKNAIQVAQKNQTNLNISNERCSIKHFDIFNSKQFEDSFDVVISNPPYIKSADVLNLESQVRDYEPHSALDGGKDGLKYYKRLLELIQVQHCKWFQKYLIIEIGFQQIEEIREIFKNYELKEYKDLCDIIRCVVIKIN